MCSRSDDKSDMWDKSNVSNLIFIYESSFRQSNCAEGEICTEYPPELDKPQKEPDVSSILQKIQLEPSGDGPKEQRPKPWLELL